MTRLLFLSILAILGFGNNRFDFKVSVESGRIAVASYMDKVQGLELIDQASESPLFEISTDRGVLSSSDPIWTYRGTEERKMVNGGTEVTYIFLGRGKASGLEVRLDNQYFKDDALVRQRLRLKSVSAKRPVRLKNVCGRNSLVFPKYALREKVGSVLEVKLGSFGDELIDGYDSARSYDGRRDPNMAECHMFHTREVNHPIGVDAELLMKGPLFISQTDKYQLITSYEHASQDQAIVRFDKSGCALDTLPSSDDYWFIGASVANQGSGSVISERILRGGYLDNEPIPSRDYYETVWSTIEVIPIADRPDMHIRQYLYEYITEHPQSRRSEFYYNTWGFQRRWDAENSSLRTVFTEENIFREIDNAARIGVDIIVLDDGWQETIGDWRANTSRLPNGLKPFVDRIRSHGMTPGIWLSLAGIDSLTVRFQEHRDWAITKPDGSYILNQWRQPVMDIVGPFYDAIKADHISLIDQGFKFFKWDAFNAFFSTLPGMGHGDDDVSAKERADRYNYLAPFVVTRLMRELREYDPEVVVELDLTEPERVMIGLMPLQEGKLFWMNNGGSAYGDYSQMRSKSMREVQNVNGKYIPQEIFTYASYPFDCKPYFAQRYNVNSILLSGHGIWGDLSLMKDGDYAWISSAIAKSKRVLPYLGGRWTHSVGRVGASPELYWQIDHDNCFGQIVAFSGSATTFTRSIRVTPETLLGAVNHSYRLDGDRIAFDFQFTMPDDTREAFILGNQGADVSIEYATGWLDDIRVDGDVLRVRAGADGEMGIRVPDVESVKCNKDFKVSGGRVVIGYDAGERVELRLK